MARTKAKATTSVDHRRQLRYLAWALFTGVWLILVISLATHDPADWPGYSAAPLNDQPQNWVGKFGAILSHKLYLMLGPGVWVLLTGYAAGLLMAAMNKQITQPVLRVLGLVCMSLATSAMVGLTSYTGWVSYDRPEGAGGLLAIFVTHELMVRFSTIGTLMILLVAFWVGAILAMDQIVAVVVGFMNRGFESIARIAQQIRLPKPVLVGKFPSLFGGGASRSSRSSVRTPRGKTTSKSKTRDEQEKEPIDEDAGGLGATESFDLDEPTVASYDDLDDDDAEDADDIEAEIASEIDEVEETDEEEPVGDAPGAYIAEKKPFTPEELREKIRKLPINLAASKKAAAASEVVREVDLSGYRFPDISLLEEPETNFNAEMEKLVREQAVVLEEALQQYRIEGEVVGIDSGPVITLFEVRLAPGTKVSQLNTIASDLARSLKAQNIRIVSNIVGKDTVGIEVPNIKKEKVRLKELMTSNQELAHRMKLPMWLGKDASGNALIADLAAMPHMLIAGTTGSGKSVCMNSIIMSFLFTKRPDELKLVLVDPKMVEMSMFKDIPHLMCPVVTEMNKAAAILEWATTKMDERYELLAEAGVRDIAGYNQLTWDDLKLRFNPQNESEEARIPKKLPYLVFVIDELADLIITNKEVEHFIVRLAQKARAVGIHLILATQRPQANVVTGLIKANMPCRVSFKVASGMDSRIVLDQKGAELLLGQGDMLFLSPRSSKLTRAQGTLVEDIEVRNTVRFLRDVALPSFEPQLVQLKAPGIGDESDSGERDPLFDDAVRVVLESQRGSVSLLQRRLTIGYSRASRLIEQMGAAGIIGEYKGSQAREVNMTLDEWDALKAQAEADATSAGTAVEEQSFNTNDDDTDDSVPDEMDDEYKQ